MRTRGPWIGEEQEWHINYKELMAVYFGLGSFANDSSDCHIQVFVDNSTALAYINNQGSRKSKLMD